MAIAGTAILVLSVEKKGVGDTKRGLKTQFVIWNWISKDKRRQTKELGYRCPSEPDWLVRATLLWFANLHWKKGIQWTACWELGAKGCDESSERLSWKSPVCLRGRQIFFFNSVKDLEEKGLYYIGTIRSDHVLVVSHQIVPGTNQSFMSLHSIVSGLPFESFKPESRRVSLTQNYCDNSMEGLQGGKICHQLFHDKEPEWFLHSTRQLFPYSDASCSKRLSRRNGLRRHLWSE